MGNPLIVVPGAPAQGVQAGGIPAQVLELPHGGQLIPYMSPRNAMGGPALIGPPAEIPAGVMLLALDPETARKVRAALRPAPIV